MASIVVNGDTSGAVTLSAPATAGTVTVTLPSTSGTMATLTTPSFATTIGVGGATPSASGAGITFPATQSASSDANTLDDYEEGTWTPVLGGATSESGQSYAVNSGSYTKIGNQVFCTMRISLTTAGTITGNAVIKGLPFQTSTSSTDYAGASIAYIDTVGTAVVSVGFLAQQNRTSLDVYYRTAASTTQTVAGNTFWANGSSLFASIVYHST